MRKPPIQRSFLNALTGIWQMLKSERNFQIELAAAVLNILLILYLQLDKWDAALILLCCVLVLSAEILNTAIEKICDLVRPEFDLRVKFIKDISAGAVFLLAVLSVIVGILIYSKYIF